MSYDLQIVNGDLTINNGDLGTVTDTAKLEQDILKICLTNVGSNPLQPGYGSFLSRTIIGNPIYTSTIVQIAKAQLNTCLTNLQTLQQNQIKQRQRVTADEQLAAITNISVVRNTIDPRLFNVIIKCLTKGFTPVTTQFSVSTI
jgi:phage baseplate assembly protein W